MIRYKDLIYNKTNKCGKCVNLLVKPGMFFGDLKIVKKIGINNLCECSCGNFKIFNNSPLLKGKIKTCNNIIHKIGNKNNNWKGGIRNKANCIRKSKKYTEWRTKCFERDNYTCQVSGIKGGKIVVHHLEPFHLLWDDVNGEIIYNEIAFDINNGITITEDLHKEFHKKYGNKNFTKENFLEFLEYKKAKPIK